MSFNDCIQEDNKKSNKPAKATLKNAAARGKIEEWDTNATQVHLLQGTGDAGDVPSLKHLESGAS